MNPVLLLTRLNPRTQAFSKGATGGVSEFTPEFIAAALARLPRLNALLLLWVWCMDDRVIANSSDVRMPPDSQKGLVALVRDMCRGVIRREFHGRDYARLDALTRALLMEIRDTCRCDTCNGRGYLFDDVEGFVECSNCGGTGNERYSNRKRSRCMEMSHTQFRREHEPVYNACFRELVAVQEAGLRQLWHQTHRE